MLYPGEETVTVYGPPTGKNAREKYPAEPEIVVLETPVGVCSASTEAPETFTLPLKEDVVSTSELMGTAKKEISAIKENCLNIEVLMNYPLKIEKPSITKNKIYIFT